MKMLEHALEYAGRGWPVFPVHGIIDGRCTCGDAHCSSPGKHPIIAGGVKSASTDLDVVTNWWTLNPDANVAIATGAGSGLLVVDVDVGSGKHGLESLRGLEETNSPLPESLRVRTGSGGLHIYFAMPSQEVRNSAGRIAEGIDIRAEGGYVVAPPSAHISGNFYAWESYDA